MIDFIHIGMPKVASTWLQDNLFEAHPDLAVLHNGYTLKNKEVRHQYSQLVNHFVHGTDFKESTSRFWQEINKQLISVKSNKLAAGLPAYRIGLSHEVLSGAWLTGRNAYHLATLLCNQNSNLKVIIFIRHQKSMLESSYAQYIRHGGTTGFERFLLDPYVLGDGAASIDDARRTPQIEYFKYGKLIELYYDLVGKANVYVGTLEALSKNTQTIVNELTDFLSIAPLTIDTNNPTNPRLSTLALLLLRSVNHLFYTRYHCNYIGIRDRILERVVPKNVELRYNVNPYLQRQWFSNVVQNRIAFKFLPKIDQVLLHRLPSFGASRATAFDSLPLNLQMWLRNEYALDNERLQRSTGINLKSLGYWMPGQESEQQL